MRIETSRDIGRVWLVAGAVFITSVAVVRSFGRGAETQNAALWIGYVGLGAVGAALLASSYWVTRRGPTSRLVRIGLSALLAVALVLWLFALVFPFL